ncbi:MAG: hypothetical protein ACFBSG_04635 [Leptolyngbyaceae cyanobacterium]
MIIDPHYPNIILAFAYRESKIEIEKTQWEGVTAYAAWVSHETGTAVAVPKAWTRIEAIQQAKQWVDRKIYGAARR